ncbi:MAG: M48 family metalloprotease [Acidobacteriia bacterium]|nr:M48 family metalloprotease [Terriglobia bacterium]
MKRIAVLASAAAVLVVVQVAAQVRDIKPGFNIFSPEQDVQMGREAVKEIEHTKPILHNDDVDVYLSRVGQRLAQSRHAGEFPFRFHAVNDKVVNAFAFPGGPVYVNSGLLASIDSETELAAVLAHEMSHVALRHGTHQATKSIPIAAAAAFFGAMIGDDSTLSQLTQFGINFGAQSMLLHYSRESESEADLNGVLILHDTGYDPRGMARFFERLEAEGTQPSGAATFLSDHPSPGNRVEVVDREIRMLSHTPTHETDPRAFARVQRIASHLAAHAAGDVR